MEQFLTERYQMITRVKLALKRYGEIFSINRKRGLKSFYPWERRYSLSTKAKAIVYHDRILTGNVIIRDNKPVFINIWNDGGQTE